MVNVDSAIEAVQIVRNRERLNLLIFLEHNKPKCFSVPEMIDIINTTRAEQGEGPISRHAVYGHLKLMTEKGYLNSEFNPQEGRRGFRFYYANNKGQELLDWLGFTVEKIREIIEQKR